MFELVQYLTQGADALHQRYKKNPISLDAGCQLFIAFVTLYIHELRVSTSSSPALPLNLTAFAELYGLEERARPAREAVCYECQNVPQKNC